MNKTNAMRILDSAKISYDVFEYVVDESDLSGVHIAESAGLDADTVFKTLVAKGDKNGLLVFCIPCAYELDLKKCARISGDKKIELLPVKDLLSHTGYIRGGCSPVGMKKQYPTFIDESCLIFDKIYVSGGMRGCQIRLCPSDLIELISMTVCDLTF